MLAENRGSTPMLKRDIFVDIQTRFNGELELRK
jgi:hypothetical protein